MEDLLITTIEEFTGYPVYLQGSLTGKYPDHFFTFWNVESENTSYYDNDSESYLYVYDLNFYSIDPSLVYTALRFVIKELKSKGFIISGDGHSVASDEESHDGRGVTVYYRKN